MAKELTIPYITYETPEWGTLTLVPNGKTYVVMVPAREPYFKDKQITSTGIEWAKEQIKLQKENNG